MFVTFGTSHITALALILAASCALLLATRFFRSPKIARNIRWGLATTLIVSWVWWFVLVAARQWISLATILPMHLCDWTTIAVIATLLSLDKRTYDLAYFWGLGGTTQALLTPDIASDFPDQRFLIFFGLHGAVLCSVLFLTLGLHMRPRFSSIPRVVSWSMLYLALAFAVDEIFGTNFGYLRAKPRHASLLDAFAPWPYYIGELALLGALMVLILYAPFYVLDRKSGYFETHG